jgi:hypothetical protein
MSNKKYRVSNTGKEYWTRVEGKKTIYQHREIMEQILGRKLLKTEHVDHIDGNGLNNNPENLRIATRTENMRNQKKKSGNRSSQYKGVNFYKRYNKWQSRATVNYKSVSLGYYDTEIEAAIAYDNFVKKEFGEFAKTNF